jgi:hypothetical protein
MRMFLRHRSQATFERFIAPDPELRKSPSLDKKKKIQKLVTHLCVSTLMIMDNRLWIIKSYLLQFVKAKHCGKMMGHLYFLFRSIQTRTQGKYSTAQLAEWLWTVRTKLSNSTFSNYVNVRRRETSRQNWLILCVVYILQGSENLRTKSNGLHSAYWIQQIRIHRLKSPLFSISLVELHRTLKIHSSKLRWTTLMKRSP